MFTIYWGLQFRYIAYENWFRSLNEMWMYKLPFQMIAFGLKSLLATEISSITILFCKLSELQKNIATCSLTIIKRNKYFSHLTDLEFPSLLKQSICQQAIIYTWLDNILLTLYLSLCNIVFPFFLVTFFSCSVILSFSASENKNIQRFEYNNFYDDISQTRFLDAIKCYTLIYQIIYWMTLLSQISSCYFQLKSLVFYEVKCIFDITLCLLFKFL